MKLSIVTSLYKSEKHVGEFIERSIKAANKFAQEDYEIVLVNDGSPDKSLEKATEWAQKNSKVKVVDLSRNFGHHKALIAGLHESRGENVFLLDSDLEEEPEWLEDFYSKMKNQNCDLIYGVQEKRKGGIFEKLSGWLFYKILNLLTEFKPLKNVVTARIMTRRYLNAFLSFKEKEYSIAGLFFLAGFKQDSLKVKKHSHSEPTYTLGHKITLMVDSITSFSNKPLVIVFYTGLLVLVISMLGIFYLLMNWIFFSTPLTGWTSLMASIWFLGGLIVVSIGIVGVYLSRVYMETKQRPSVIVREVIGGKS